MCQIYVKIFVRKDFFVKFYVDTIMELLQLLDRAGFKKKEIAARLCIGLRSVQNYANGTQPVPESVEKLIRYEFAQDLPEEERLVAESEKAYSKESAIEINRLQRRIEGMEQLNKELKRDKQMLQLHIETLTTGSADKKKPV